MNMMYPQEPGTTVIMPTAPPAPDLIDSNDATTIFCTRQYPDEVHSIAAIEDMLSEMAISSVVLGQGQDRDSQSASLSAECVNEQGASASSQPSTPNPPSTNPPDTDRSSENSAEATNLKLIETLTAATASSDSSPAQQPSDSSNMTRATTQPSVAGRPPSLSRRR